MSVAGSVGDILPIIGDGPLYPNSNRYITGGVAYGSFRTTPPPPDTFTDRAKAGWTVGSGVEYGFAGPWSAKLEYLYADLGKQRCASASCTAAGGIDVTLKTHMVRSGLNYHFTGLPF